MPFSSILDVAIGVAFVYLFFSLICSVVNEGIAAVLSLRAKNLLAGIESLFSEGELSKGTSFVEAIYNHGLIRGLFRDPIKGKPVTGSSGAEQVKKTFGADILPSYIPSRSFAIALLDLLMPAGATVAQVTQGAVAGPPRTAVTPVNPPALATQPPVAPAMAAPQGGSLTPALPARTLDALYGS